MEKDKPLLVFIHMHKTGGTTVRKYLDILFEKNGQRAITFRTQWDFLKNFKQIDQEDFSYLSGHIQADIHNYVSRPCLYFTFLREPLARRVSWYYQILRDKEHFFSQTLFDKKITLNTFLSKAEFEGTVLPKHNGMTFRLFKGLLFPVYRRAEFITPAMLDKAKSELRDRFFFVGLLERFSDSIFMLSHKIQRKPLHYRRANLNKYSTANIIEQLPPEVIDQFEENNRFDIELYNYAKKLFKQQWDELDVAKKRAARYYRQTQRLYEKLPSPRKIKRLIPS